MPGRAYDDDMRYLINQVYPTLQGEGVMTGTPMVMVRLQGCLVGCPWCDTKYTWVVKPSMEVNTFEEAAGFDEHFVTRTPEDLAVYLRQSYGQFTWILVSGGEPAWNDLRPLVTVLHTAQYKVALETSGTETGHVNAGFDWVTVSPKINMPGKRVIQPEAVAVADEIKYVIGKPADIDTLDEFLSTYARKTDCIVSLQPLSLNEKATRLCIDTCLQRGWRLSVQVHKLLSLS